MEMELYFLAGILDQVDDFSQSACAESRRKQGLDEEDGAQTVVG
jgi:hypothetical protein